MEERPVLVAVEGACAAYGGKPCLHDIQLEIREGEMISLLGPSGCGKTTLLRLLAGRLKPSLGRICYHGLEKGGLGAVLQGEGLARGFRLKLQMQWRLARLGIRGEEAEKNIREALSLMEMEEWAACFPDELSLGQQKRAEVAMALVGKPQMLLLDDPFCAMDEPARIRLLRQLKSWQEERGASLVYVTANQQEALGLSHRILLMYQGRILRQGEPRQVLEAPESHFAASFFRRGNLLPGRIGGCGEGKAALEMDGYTLPCLTKGPVLAGEEMALYIHYQSLLYGPRQQGKMYLSGILKEYIQGPEGRLAVIELVGGRQLMAHPRRENDCPLGSRVFLWWNMERAALFPWDEKAAR